MWDLSLFVIPSSDVRFKSLTYAFMGFHKKYRIFKVDSFPSSDVRFKSSCRKSWVFMKNIEFSKLTRFPVQMWDSSLLYTHSWVFMKNIVFFKVHIFPSSDVRFKSLSFAFKSFNEKLPNYKSSPFSQFRWEIQVSFIRIHGFL